MTDSLHLVFGLLFLIIVCCGFVVAAMMEASSSSLRRRESAFAKSFSLSVFESERVAEEKEEKNVGREEPLIVEADVSSLETKMSVVNKPRRIVSTVRPGGKASQKEAEVVTPKAATVDFIRAEELMEKGAGFSQILGRNLENVLIQSTEEGKQAVSDAVRKEVSEGRHARVAAPANEESRRIAEVSMRRRHEREAAEAHRLLWDWEAALREDKERKERTERALVTELRKKLAISVSFDPIRTEKFARKTEPGHRTNDPEERRQLRAEMRGTTGGGNNRHGQKKNKGEKNKKNGDGKK